MAPTSRLVGAKNLPNSQFLCKLAPTRRLVGAKNLLNFQDPEVEAIVGEHNHNPNDEFYKRETKRKLREVATNSGFATRRVVQEATKGSNEEEYESLPQTAAMKRLVQRARKKKEFPNNPLTRHGFEIPDKYKEYLGKLFLKFDSGIDDPQRILIFVTDDGIKHLERYPNWSADGTFKSAPKIFYQLFMVHVHINNIQTVPR